jgi:hypothetical protein
VPDLSEVKLPAAIQLLQDWSAVADVPVQHVNQALAQIGVPSQDGAPDGIYISLGSSEPPLVYGNEDERKRTLEALSTIKVTVYGRFHISRGQLDDLIGVLHTIAEQYDVIVDSLAAAQHQDLR